MGCAVLAAGVRIVHGELWLLCRDGLAQTHTHSTHALRSCGLQDSCWNEQALRNITLPRPAVCVAACGMGALAAGAWMQETLVQDSKKP